MPPNREVETSLRFSEEDKGTIWDMREAGVAVERIAKHLGRRCSSLRSTSSSRSTPVCRSTFATPRARWQRGSNENTNGLLRQYPPKTADLSQVTQRELDTIARSLNTRPRQTLGWMTPSQAFAEAVALTV